MKVGILGNGEVGSAIKKIAGKKHEVFYKDRKNDYIKGQKIDVLHVCIPYSRDFIKIVSSAIAQYRPSLVIIESTVAPGTTDKIHKKTKANICHSPIRGIHPNLYEGIMTFVKYIGPATKKVGVEAKKYYKDLGLKTFTYKNAKTSEMAKLLDTTYYGWNILFQKEVYGLCRDEGVLFEEVYSEWNKSYNHGYKRLKMHHVIRPVLKHMDGKIGGHCVISNCEILKKSISDSISKIVLKHNKRY